MEKSALVWSFPWFTTPNTPDLGCFLRQEHDFALDANFFLWLEYAPWELQNNTIVFIPHQVYFRIKCGEAGYYQRVRAWMASYNSDPISLLGMIPDYVLGGDHQPYPSDWVKFPVQSGPKDYWFGGEYRNPSQPNWQRDASVGHSFERYDNGTLSTVGWDDTGQDKDYDDLILEVAVVYRRSYFDSLDLLEVDHANDSAMQRFLNEDLPKYQSSVRLSPDVRKKSGK